MKYYKLEFRVEPLSEEACDVLSALLADAGFETFVPTEQGLTAYVQQQLYDEVAVKGIADNFMMPDCNITFTCEEAPDEDWNETWEAEGFEPIVLDDLVCVHDTHNVGVGRKRRTEPRAACCASLVALDLFGLRCFVIVVKEFAVLIG